jgi:hypothetical protein
VGVVYVPSVQVLEELVAFLEHICERFGVCNLLLEVTGYFISSVRLFLVSTDPAIGVLLKQQHSTHSSFMECIGIVEVEYTKTIPGLASFF